MLEEFHCELFPSPSSSNWKRLSSWFFFSTRLCLSVYLFIKSAASLRILLTWLFLFVNSLSQSSRCISFSVPPTRTLPPCLFPLSSLSVCHFSPFRPDPRMLVHSIGDVFFSLPSTSSAARKRRIWRDSWELLLLFLFPSPSSSGQAAQITATRKNSEPEIKSYIAICIIIFTV